MQLRCVLLWWVPALVRAAGLAMVPPLLLLAIGTMQEDAPALPAATAASAQPAADGPAAAVDTGGAASPLRTAANGHDVSNAAPPPPPAAAVAAMQDASTRVQQQQHEQDGGGAGGWVEAAPAAGSHKPAGPAGPLGNIKFKLKL